MLRERGLGSTRILLVKVFIINKQNKSYGKAFSEKTGKRYAYG